MSVHTVRTQHTLNPCASRKLMQPGQDNSDEILERWEIRQPGPVRQLAPGARPAYLGLRTGVVATE